MEKPIRILHLLTVIIPDGGVQRLVLGYGEKTRTYNVVFDYVVQGKGDSVLEQRCLEAESRIFEVPEMTRRPLGFVKELYRILKEHPEYKIFHVHNNFLNFVPLITAWVAKTPVRISHSHNSYTTSRLKQLIRNISRWMIIASGTDLWGCSCLAYEWLYGKPYTPSANNYILHNATDCSRFSYDAKRRQLLRKAGGLQDEFVCICVGVLSERKNQSFLMDVMHHVQKLTPRRKVCLWLVGDGDRRAELEEKCRQLGLTDDVRFWGVRSDVPDLLQQADCLLLPSHAEGLPVSAVEAQACGLPCILSSEITREVAVSQHVTFCEIGVENAKVWAEQIVRYAGLECDRATPLPDDCGFHITQEAQKLAEKYRSLLGREGTAQR